MASDTDTAEPLFVRPPYDTEPSNGEVMARVNELHDKFDAILDIIGGIKDQVQPLVDSLQELPFLGKALKRGVTK